MRAILIALLLLLSACASGTQPGTVPLPDWSGPAVHCRHLGDRSLIVELLAPTASHRLTMVDVTVDDSRADIRLLHQPPGSDVLVAQVITPLTVEVPAARLGAARAVCVWIATGNEAPRLALATARPR